MSLTLSACSKWSVVRLSAKSLTTKSIGPNTKLTKGANKTCPHYDNTRGNFVPLRLEDNARKHTAYQRKTTFLH